MNHPHCPVRRFGAVLILIPLVAGMVVRADDADSKQAAVAAMQAWLTEMDQGPAVGS